MYKFKYVGHEDTKFDPDYKVPKWVNYRGKAYETGKTVTVDETEAEMLRHHKGFVEE